MQVVKSSIVEVEDCVASASGNLIIGVDLVSVVLSLALLTDALLATSHQDKPHPSFENLKRPLFNHESVNVMEKMQFLTMTHAHARTSCLR